MQEAVSTPEEQGSFHCAACNKFYKNASQLSNHEKSAKHKQMVAKLRKQLNEDAELNKDLEELGIEEGEPAARQAHGDDTPDDGEARSENRGGGKQGKKKKKDRRDALFDEDIDGEGGADDVSSGTPPRKSDVRDRGSFCVPRKPRPKTASSATVPKQR